MIITDSLSLEAQLNSSQWKNMKKNDNKTKILTSFKCDSIDIKKPKETNKINKHQTLP